MSDHPIALAILADILDHPKDDTPRLVLADWLDDHGDPERAEFIRYDGAHVFLRRPLKTYGGEGGVWKLVKCAGSRAVVWRQAVPLMTARGSWVWPVGTEITFRRGFIAEVRCPLAAWEECGTALVARHPIERVGVTNLPVFGEGYAVPALLQTSFDPVIWTAMVLMAKGSRPHETQLITGSRPDLEMVASVALLAVSKWRARQAGLWPVPPAPHSSGSRS